jgi:hypothetical protein
MAPSTAAAAPEDAEQALDYLTEMSPDLRGAAILSGRGDVLAARGEPVSWGDAATELLRAADAAGGEPAEQVHVATADGEVFALRSGALAAVAVTDRFALASLTLFDLRSVLRSLQKGER